MRTLGRRSPRALRGDSVRHCDYCGAAYYLSQLRRNVAGFLVCRDDDGDRHYAKAPHIQNNEGTGSSSYAGEAADPLPVIL